MSRVSGDLSHEARILVYDVPTQALEHDQVHSAGAYQVDGLLNSEKIVTAIRTSDDKALAYGGVDPYLENIQVQKSVNTVDDDGWYAYSGSNFSKDGAFIYIYYPYGADYRGWARFTGINVAQGQSLTSATLRVYHVNSLGTGKNCRFFCNDVDNAVAVTSWSDGRDKVRTSAYRQHVFSTGTAGTYEDINVLSPVQEVINRGGWSPNNAIQILMDGYNTDSYLNLGCYASAQPAPRLTLVYEG